jgi:hypothetical protein
MWILYYRQTTIRAGICKNQRMDKKKKNSFEKESETKAPRLIVSSA